RFHSHCCLWRIINQSELNVPLEERGRKSPRTLQNIIDDNLRFQNVGSPMSKAKQFNSAIRPPLFNIPINQVCLPGLHISMGIFNRLF
ncbi:hypothetical protein QZH41_010941, partial [Actinostola sp. cb2023]